MQVVETQDKVAYNDFLKDAGGSLLQAWQWGDFQKRIGRRVRRLILTSNAGNPIAAAQVVSSPLVWGRSYYYCPRGPVWKIAPRVENTWQLFLDKLQDSAILDRPVFLRVDPMVTSLPAGLSLIKLGFTKTGWEVQPKTTILLDLNVSESVLLHSMKPKTRYNIHLAERKGVRVEEYFDSRHIRVFWDLMKETTARDKFHAHPSSYYAHLLEILGRSRSASLLVAWYQNRPLAGAIVGFFGQTATYLHGASSDKLRNAMASYAMQWAAIQNARKRGFGIYDFGGITAEATSNHAWAGITRFKKGFGGREVSFVGAFDLPYSRRWYQVYQTARYLRRLSGL